MNNHSAMIKIRELTWVHHPPDYSTDLTQMLPIVTTSFVGEKSKDHTYSMVRLFCLLSFF